MSLGPDPRLNQQTHDRRRHAPHHHQPLVRHPRTGGRGVLSQCGWLKDRYGLSWQVVPTVLEEYLTDEDPERAARAMAEMLTQSKIDIAAIRVAADG